MGSPYLMGRVSLHMSCCSLSKLGGIVDRAHLIFDVTSSCERYFEFMHTRALNPASHKYVLPKGTNISKAHCEISGYSSLAPNQNSSTATRECSPCCVLSRKILVTPHILYVLSQNVFCA